MEIITPCSILRNWRPLDAKSLVKHADNPRIAAKMRDAFPSPYKMADAEQFISMATGSTPHLFLAIEFGGEAVGGIGIHLQDDVRHRSAEIGYWLSESLWGKGIITDAVRSLVPIAFKRYDLIRLEAGIFSNNPASMRVLEKCGFFYEAVCKDAITKNGILLDEVVYVFFSSFL